MSGAGLMISLNDQRSSIPVTIHDWSVFCMCVCVCVWNSFSALWNVETAIRLHLMNFGVKLSFKQRVDSDIVDYALAVHTFHYILRYVYIICPPYIQISSMKTRGHQLHFTREVADTSDKEWRLFFLRVQRIAAAVNSLIVLLNYLVRT